MKPIEFSTLTPVNVVSFIKRWFGKVNGLCSVGLGAVTRKELADHLSGKRLLILLDLVAVTGLSSIYVAALTIRQSASQVAEGGFVFLLLFTTSGSSLPSFLTFLGFLGPLVGLALGFDSINGERARGTLSRILSQPIHRDSVINGKFLAGLIAVSLTLVALALVVSGLGIQLIGIPPSTEEVLRVVCFVALTIVYVSFWLSVSILFSVIFRQAATSALAGVAVWLFFTIFARLLAGLVADAVVPLPAEPTALELLRHQRIEMALSRLSPTTLYYEATSTLLTPHVRALGPIVLEQLEGAIPGPLPLGQSLLLIWPHITGMIAATLICFAASYVIFMRQEIRAT